MFDPHFPSAWLHQGWHFNGSGMYAPSMFGADWTRPPTKKNRKKASKVVAATSPPSVSLDIIRPTSGLCSKEPAYITVPDDPSTFASTSVQSSPDSIQMTEGCSLPTTPVRISPKFPPPVTPAPKFGLSLEGFAPPTWDGTELEPQLEPPPGLPDCGTLAGSKAGSQMRLEPPSAPLLMQPPGLDQVAEAPPASTSAASTIPFKDAGLSTVRTDVDGKAYMRAEWRIAIFAQTVEKKLGRALVSPEICLSPDLELPNLELNVQMIDHAELDGLRAKPKQSQLTKLLKQGKLRFQLALKMTSSIPLVAPITFYLTLGDGDKRQRKGESVGNDLDWPTPFETDFSESAMYTYNVFKTDWLELMDGGGLTVGLEILVQPP